MSAQLWGVGRYPRSAGVKHSYTINATFSGGMGAYTDTETLALGTALPEAVYGVVVSVRPMNSNGTTGDATNPRFQVYLDGELVAQYQLNATSSDTAEWFILDYLPIQKQLWGASHELKVTQTAEGTGGNFYAVKGNVTVLTIEI